jgi:hypothetical protein
LSGDDVTKEKIAGCAGKPFGGIDRIVFDPFPQFNGKMARDFARQKLGEADGQDGNVPLGNRRGEITLLNRPLK